jgi:hypothetical protein
MKKVDLGSVNGELYFTSGRDVHVRQRARK